MFSVMRKKDCKCCRDFLHILFLSVDADFIITRQKKERETGQKKRIFVHIGNKTNNTKKKILLK